MSENEEVTEEISESPAVPTELETKPTEETPSESEAATSEPELSDREKLYKTIQDDRNPDLEEETEDEATEELEKKVEETPKTSEEPEDAEPEDLETRLKNKVQKRIGKEVAKRKTAEERATELEAENAELRSKVEARDKPEEKESRDPTDAELDAEYEKALSEGDFKYATQINRFIIKKQKEEALLEVSNKNDAATKQAQLDQNKWTKLVTDFTVYNTDKSIDTDHPLNLNNSSSALYKTAMSFMQDKDIAKEYGYDNTDKILGFRLAVNDARRELMEASERGELKLDAHKKNGVAKPSVTKKRRRAALATPATESAGTEETPRAKTPQDKATLEIQRRNKLKFERAGVQAI